MHIILSASEASPSKMAMSNAAAVLCSSSMGCIADGEGIIEDRTDIKHRVYDGVEDYQLQNTSQGIFA